MEADMMARLEVGTIVTIRSDLSETMRGVAVTRSMLNYRGVTTRIKYVRDSYSAELGYSYGLECDSDWHAWESWMFEEFGTATCEHCGGEIAEGQLYRTHDGKVICEHCKNTYYKKCRFCGKYELNENSKIVDDYLLCRTCYENHVFECSCCGESHLETFMRHDVNGEIVCNSCFDERCTCCERCDRVIWRSEAYHLDNRDGDFCESCHDYLDNEVIVSYHGFSNWKLHTTDNENKYSSVEMGIELEVEREESSISTNKMAKTLRDEFLGGLAVYEHDGSLDDGFEIITHPMTYDYWANNADSKITQALKYLKDNGYTSHDNNTCGLHIHVNKESLATNSRTQDEVIDNIILIMETFKNELTRFSRRSSGQISRWSHFLTTSDDEVTLSYVKDKKTTGDRYLALNLAKGKTIEFRIFKGSLIKETLYASLELVKNIVNIAKYKDINGLTWNDIIEYHKTVNKYLMQYSTTRGITSTVVLNVLSKYEVNKEQYSLACFLNGDFAIDCRCNNRESIYKITTLKSMLAMKNINIKHCDNDTILNNYYGLYKYAELDGFLFKSAEYKNIVLLYDIDEIQEKEIVKMNTILKLWFENKKLLDLKNKTQLVA